ncbi:c-type cytochrome [Litorimonas sp. RW-G-Af-16]|uniref:c-type cytochrome n=1 Tax=Litorimonas sp. RW-G-Af-16 TaxID=3241168 RepID=UPI00390CC90F
MDELGFTKIAAAVLATALGVMLIRTLPHMLMHSDYPEMPLYSVGSVAVADAGEEVDLPFPQPEWIAAMDVERGAKVFKKCVSCHNAEDGGKNGTGPNLWGVVGATPGTHDGFNYSSAMAEMGTPWTFEQLDGFLTKPSAYLKGTKMAYIGIKKAEDRAAVIEYLRLAAANPIPQPEPAIVDIPAEELVEGTQPPAMEPTVDPSENDGNNIAEPAEGQKPMTEDEKAEVQ